MWVNCCSFLVFIQLVLYSRWAPFLFIPSLVVVVYCLLYPICLHYRISLLFIIFGRDNSCVFNIVVGITLIGSTLCEGVSLLFSILGECLLEDTDPLLSVLSESGIIHRPLFWHLCPHNITLPLYII